MDQQPVSDDQELAKVLAGVSEQADEVAAAPAPIAIQPTPAPIEEPAVELAVPAPVTFPSLSADDASNLDSIKGEALNELRPLMDKLTVSPEEKYDIYLLLLRSTDDKSLIAPAHEAAKAIEDETRRAQALLDIIKEIDFLSGETPTAPTV